MTRFINISEIRWNFYESMNADDKESMADYFESLFHHYQNRGKRIKSLLKNSTNAKTNKDLTDFQKENPKCPSDTSLNPDIKCNKNTEAKNE
jgi:hypothetical protein